MARDAVVHLIDDDDGVRQAVAFLLTTSGYAVRVYEFGGGLPRGAADGAAGLHRHRRAHAGDGRAGTAAAVEAARRRAAGDRHHRPWRRAAGGGGDEGRRGRFHRKAVQRRKAAVRHPRSPSIGIPATPAARTKSPPSAPRSTPCRRASARCWTGLWPGLPNKTIAYDLKISARTVEVHRANLMARMGAGSLAELVRMAFVIRSGLR